MPDRPDAVLAGRRHALMGLAAAAGTTLLATDRAAHAAGAPGHEGGSATLAALTAFLATAPRRRDFRTVPMILDNPDLWDAAALEAVIAYRGSRKQVWDNTEINGGWINMMRNSVNAQLFSFRHPDFLVVSATHGAAHLALFDQAMWDKYRLADMAGPEFTTNTLMIAGRGTLDPASHQDPQSLFGPAGNTIPTLQKRGAVFLACHNAIWELAAKRMQKNVNPDHLSHEQMAAELTNHLIEGVVLTPGMVATIPELEHTGFGYVK
jgi:hypothetical protein